MKYLRWIGFGVVAVGLIAALLLVGANKNLRKKIESLLLERFIKNKIEDLKGKVSEAKTQADLGKIRAEDAEKISESIDEAISIHKEKLQKKLEDRGLDADEISTRFNSLRI